MGKMTSNQTLEGTVLSLYMQINKRDLKLRLAGKTVTSCFRIT